MRAAAHAFPSQGAPPRRLARTGQPRACRRGRAPNPAVASLARQSNDNALIAQAALAYAEGKVPPEGLADALARRAAIDALRARATRIADQIATMPASNLTRFDAASPILWGEA
jgi:hypothetical protein